MPRCQAQKMFQEVGDKAAESVACVHLAQAMHGGPLESLRGMLEEDEQRSRGRDQGGKDLFSKMM